ncbi:MAG: hypothetical protein R3Y05_05665, partial [bacterium]
MNQINLQNILFLNRCDEVAIEILEGEIIKIAKHLNIKPWKYTFHRFNEISFIDPIKQIIRFKYNEELDFDRMVITLAHELRHQYQFEAMNKDHKNKKLWIKEYNKLIKEKDNYKKIFNPLEIDAAAYAINYVKKFYNAKITISDTK